MQSLAVGNSEVEGQSRITMVIPGSAEGTSKIVKQLNKLVNVQQVSTVIPMHARRKTFWPRRLSNTDASTQSHNLITAWASMAVQRAPPRSSSSSTSSFMCSVSALCGR